MGNQASRLPANIPEDIRQMVIEEMKGGDLKTDKDVRELVFDLMGGKSQAEESDMKKSTSSKKLRRVKTDTSALRRSRSKGKKLSKSTNDAPKVDLSNFQWSQHKKPAPSTRASRGQRHSPSMKALRRPSTDLDPQTLIHMLEHMSTVDSKAAGAYFRRVQTAEEPTQRPTQRRSSKTHKSTQAIAA